MRVLITVPLFVITLCVLAICLSLLIGSRQPTPNSVVRLHLTDCALPCWDEITLGSSSLGEISDRISASFPKFVGGAGTLHISTWQYYDPRKDDTTIAVAFKNNHALSIGITSNYAAKVMPTLGDMLVIFGAPTCVVVSADSGYVTLDYDHGSDQANLQFTVARPALSSPVRTLTIGISTPSVCSKASAVSWLAYRHAQYIVS